MILPGRLTEKHIKAHRDMGHKFFTYQHQVIDVDKTWKQIQQEKPKKEKIKEDGKLESRNRHKSISSESTKNTEL
jgi:hypothetical protein